MIVVTGVHRSGTSLVAMLMEALGVDFGPRSDFYPADEWNERGYFERRDIVDLNSRIITGFGRTSGRWAPLLSQLRYLSMPSSASIARRARRLQPSMNSLAARVAPLAVKDPRFCLTLETWKKEAEIEACVVCIRHPTEVAESLRRRQRVPLMLGYRFWEYHVSALIPALPARTFIVDHRSLHGPSAAEEVARLGDFFPHPGGRPSPEAALDSVFSPELRHVRPREATGDLPPRSRDLWERLTRLRSPSHRG